MGEGGRWRGEINVGREWGADRREMEGGRKGGEVRDMEGGRRR